MSTNAVSTRQLLPKGFDDLEPYVEKWAKDTTEERMAVRAESSMEEIREFYDIILERADEAMTLIDEYPLDDLPEDVARLCKLVLALGPCAMAVEVIGQPRVPRTPYPHGVELTRGTPPFG